MRKMLGPRWTLSAGWLAESLHWMFKWPYIWVLLASGIFVSEGPEHRSMYRRVKAECSLCWERENILVARVELGRQQEVPRGPGGTLGKEPSWVVGICGQTGFNANVRGTWRHLCFGKGSSMQQRQEAVEGMAGQLGGLCRGLLRGGLHTHKLGLPVVWGVLYSSQ